ncbi:hypothetical protein B0H13DRAFT_833708 [Mycena leptocephala]|nr:hypothetical protein B0H13DRAFT_833708 [Mycena leptocephala]
MLATISSQQDDIMTDRFEPLYPQDDLHKGGHIMLVGISAYVCLAAELMGRYVKDRPIASSDYNTSKDTMKPVVYKGTLTPHLRLVWVLALNTVCLIVRAIYRRIELLDGFQGRIISKQ